MAYKLLILVVLLAAVEAGFVSTRTGYDAYADSYPPTPSPIRLQQQADIIRARNRKLQQLHQSRGYDPLAASGRYDGRTKDFHVGGYLPPAYAFSYSSPTYSHRYPASAYAHRYAAPTNARSPYQQQSRPRIYAAAPPPFAHGYYDPAAGLHGDPRG